MEQSSSRMREREPGATLRSMKRVFLVLVLLVVGYVGVRWLVVALASDETRIRWSVEEMVAGFNEGSGKRATSGFAETWDHGDTELRRDDLRGYLLAEFQQQRSQKARRLTLRVDVPEDTLVIAVVDERATLELEARFEKLRGEEWQPLWRMRVEAVLSKGEDGWKIVETAKEDLEGRGLRG